MATWTGGWKPRMLAALVLAAAGSTAAQAGDGLRLADAERSIGPRWQVRWAVQSTLIEAMGDVYLLRHARASAGGSEGWSGGLRASGGLQVDAGREALSAAEPGAPARLVLDEPRAWLGLGYSAASASDGWSLAADLGVTLWRADAAWPASSLVVQRRGLDAGRTLLPTARLALRLRF